MKDYPPEVYELMQWLLDHPRGLWKAVLKHLFDIGWPYMRRDNLDDNLGDLRFTAGLSAFGKVALREHKQQPDKPEKTAKTKKKHATVEERMAKMFQDDPERVSWPARKWAITLDCTAAMVKQTKTWKTIMTMRALLKAERANR